MRYMLTILVNKRRIGIAENNLLVVKTEKVDDGGILRAITLQNEAYLCGVLFVL